MGKKVAQILSSPEKTESVTFVAKAQAFAQVPLGGHQIALVTELNAFEEARLVPALPTLALECACSVQACAA
jgi:hypothetical protein